MKSLLFVIALVCSFITICLCSILGIRTGPMMARAAIVFVAAYSIGLIAALLATVSMISSGGRPNSLSHPPPEIESDETAPEKAPAE